MTNTGNLTPAELSAIPATVAPKVAFDVTKLDGAIATVVTVADPFIPAKVRASIYVIGTVAATALEAVAPVVGGTVGVVVQISGAALAALVGAIALSHVSGK